MASGALKLVIREPPHRSFVQGYPGIPASADNVRPPAHISGTVEVRPKPKGVRALYVRIELKKVEQVPGNKSGSRYKELIGGALEARMTARMMMYKECAAYVRCARAVLLARSHH